MKCLKAVTILFLLLMTMRVLTVLPPEPFIWRIIPLPSRHSAQSFRAVNHRLGVAADSDGPLDHRLG